MNLIINALNLLTCMCNIEPKCFVDLFSKIYKILILKLSQTITAFSKLKKSMTKNINLVRENNL